MTTPPGDQPPQGDPHQPYQQPSSPGWYQSGLPSYGYGTPDHPKAQTAMILGILGLVLCQVLAPFALATGKRTVAEIDASGGRLGGRSQAQTGYILGIIGTVLLGLAVAFLFIYFVIVVVLIGGVATSSP